MFFAYEVHDGEEMFEIRNTGEENMFEPIPVYGGGSTRGGNPLEDVRDEVDTMQQEFSDCLRDDDMGKEELESLALILKKAPAAGYKKAAKEGAVLLEKVEAKLKTAAQDLQRFDEESLAAAHTTGRQAHRLTKAAAAIMRAKEHLQQVSES